MAEIFKEAQAFDNHPDRWNHDLSHKIYGSFKAGRLYPVLTHLMKPTDSIKLDMASLLQFMPTPTPLQSNVRVIFHTFFQRLKNVQKDFPNYIEQLEDIERPYILPSVNEFRAGSLHDYLDVPVCCVVNGNSRIPMQYCFGMNSNSFYGKYTITYKRSINGLPRSVNDFSVPFTSTDGGISLQDYGTRILPSTTTEYFDSESCVVELSCFPFSSSGDLPSTAEIRVSVSDSFGFARPSTSSDLYRIIGGAMSLTTDVPFKILFRREDLMTALDALGYTDGQVIHLDPIFYFSGAQTSNPLSFANETFALNRVTYSCLKFAERKSYIDIYTFGSYDMADFPLLCPYATRENPDAPIQLSAWRYRVYESNYNAFYRNTNGNQPFMVEGVTKYNQYNTTTESGVDRTDYHFFNRNWELDAYTSCLPSPQQGNVPYVGVSALGRLIVEDDDGNRSTAQLQDLPNGQQGLSISNVNAANDQHRSIMMRLSESGFTINDLRETNALQKFLETNIRKGFRYIDFIRGHFGVGPKHYEVDMPEFLGGFSVKLDVGKVTNTNMAAPAVDSQAVLGNFAGTAQAFGSSKHPISYFADDYGYLQVIMCIVPDSAYSQVLPKDFLYKSPLDFPFPEFSNLGYQPITYEEFCPVEAYKDFLEDDSKKLTDVFGYQRPQHECVWKPDRLHGQFLTSMNNYCVNRVFEHRPELGDAFLTIDPSEMQRNFTITKGDDDIAFGQVAYHLTCKQAVPRISIPSLGR